MTEVIMGQVNFVLASLCSGMLLLLGYDGVRLLRVLFYHHKIIRGLLDLIYWCCMSIPIYCIFFQYNEGKIRWYGLVCMLGGMLLYYAGISSPVRRKLRKPLIECMFRIADKAKKR